MTFKITKMTQKLKAGEVKQKPVNLPEAHTCFNQLVLPGRFQPIFFQILGHIEHFFQKNLFSSFSLDYNDKETLKKKLTIAISNAEGFGLE